MTTKTAAERALSEALRSGGDFAELYMEDSRATGMSLIDGKVDASTFGRGHGAGMRVYKGLNSVYVHANDTSADSLLSISRQAAEAIGALGDGRDVRLVGSTALNRHAVKYQPSDVDGSRKARLLHDAYRAAKEYDPAISQVRASSTAARWTYRS